MTVLSILRQNSQPALASFVNAYSTHRPLVQRILTAGFVIHVLVTTSRFGGLSTRPPPPSTSKGKVPGQPKASETGRPPRVAVCLNHTFQTIPTSCARLCSIGPTSRNTRSALNGGAFALHVLQLVNILLYLNVCSAYGCSHIPDWRNLRKRSHFRWWHGCTMEVSSNDYGVALGWVRIVLHPNCLLM
jgi:hypothetical protein